MRTSSGTEISNRDRGHDPNFGILGNTANRIGIDQNKQNFGENGGNFRKVVS